jgi:hypothetical protein
MSTVLNNVKNTLIGILFIAFAVLLTQPKIVEANDVVCPHGGDWTKIDGSNPSFEAPAGKIIVEVCVKGGSDASPNGYKEFFTEDGEFKVTYDTNDGEVTKTCVEVNGIGTNEAEAKHGNASERFCAEISHASFRVADPDEDEDIPGCPDEDATNYNPDATVDDGSCEYHREIPGCPDEKATNYNPDATVDDNSCEYDDEDDDKDDDDDDDNDGEILSSSTRRGGAVLGTSALAATGTAEENLMNVTFVLGAILLSLGVKKYALKTV